MLHSYRGSDPRPMTIAIGDGCQGEAPLDIEVTGEFTCLRVDPRTVPEGKVCYFMRHDDNGDFTAPVTIKNGGILVNHCGTFVCDPIPGLERGKEYIINSYTI